MKVKIIRLSKNDAWYNERKKIVGSVGKFINHKSELTKPWMNGSFIPDNPIHPFPDAPNCVIEDFFFAYVKFEQVKDE